ncbi:MAG: hypothetical protein LBC37_04225 [Zoogloeaceae bacterium]|jgi:hypothetical protein|nr:hypothetical protein [Zoogloeaceae bacterium]
MSNRLCPVCEYPCLETAKACSICGWDFSPALFGSQEEAQREHETRLAAARAVWREKIAGGEARPFRGEVKTDCEKDKTLQELMNSKDWRVLEAHLVQHPGSPYGANVLSRMAELLHDQGGNLDEDAQECGRILMFVADLLKRNGYDPDALNEDEWLGKVAAFYLLGKKAFEAACAQENGAWQALQDSQDWRAFRAYCQEYPNSPHKKEALDKMVELQLMSEDVSEDELDETLASLYVAVEQSIEDDLAALPGEESAWIRLKTDASSDWQAFGTYLREYPNSPHKAEAQKMMLELLEK